MVKFTQSGPVYYHHDGLGSTIALTDEIVESYTYDAFGAASVIDASGLSLQVSAFSNRFLFTGREFSAEVGLYDYRNRVYSPDLGRFLQTDPIRFSAGDINLYRYVSNNPISRRDPWGLDEKKPDDDENKDDEEEERRKPRPTHPAPKPGSGEPGNYALALSRLKMPDFQLRIGGGAGLGGMSTFGHHDGQWNFGGYIGLGAGLFGKLDFPANGSRADPGFYTGASAEGSLIGIGVASVSGRSYLGQQGNSASISGRLGPITGGFSSKGSNLNAHNGFSFGTGGVVGFGGQAFE